MGILNEKLDEILIIRVADLISTFNLSGFHSLKQRRLIYNEILNEDIETIIDCNKFIDKYCKPFNLSAEMHCVDVERPDPIIGQIYIDIFHRVKSGAKFNRGVLLLNVKDSSLINSVRTWNKNNKVL